MSIEPLDPHYVFLERRDLIMEALTRGVERAIALHRERGLPMVIEEDRQIRWVSAEKLSASP